MFKNFLNAQTKSISFASLILAVSYLVSALLGLLRDRLLAGEIGTERLDAYYAAFVVPDFIAIILVFGAISAAIIPIFISYYEKSQEEAWQYVSALLNIFLIFLIVICLIFIIFSPFFVSLIAPGFSGDKKAETVLLMRIMFLSPIILGVSNIISGILQTFHRFLATAVAPIMYNLGIIFGILFFSPKFGLIGLSFGVVFGGILHLLIQIPSFFYSGFRIKNILTFCRMSECFYGFKSNFAHPGVLKTFKLMAPRSLGLGAGQFNVVVINAIASTLVSGSVAIFNLANNLSSMLVSAIAVSLSTVVFPSMSKDYLKDDKTDFEKKFYDAFLQVVFLSVPASILIFILRAQIVRIVLGTGKFNWLDTRLTAACLGIFGLGLCFQGLIFILSKTFYAAHDTKIPAIISVATVIFNILMSLFFVWLLGLLGLFNNFIRWGLKLDGIESIGVIGLALAYSFTAIVESILLLFFLCKKLKTFKAIDIFKPVIKILISGAVMSIAIILTRQWLIEYNFISLQTFGGVFFQLLISASAGIGCYLLVSYLLKLEELKKMKQLFLKG